MLALSNITKSFDHVTALDSFSLDVRNNETTILIGPSGCGKSTVLRLMIGLVQPDEGVVKFDNEQVDPRRASGVRRRMGYVIQDGGLFPNLTAKGNVVLMAEFLGWPSGKIENRLNELIELTQFPDSGINRYPAELSGGQQQRIGLMRALMLDPDVLLLDEPLGALDPMVRFDLQTELRNIFKKLRKTVVMVTHDLSEAAYFGDTIVLMREGRIVQKGNLKSLMESPIDSFVSRFINAQRKTWDAVTGESE